MGTETHNGEHSILDAFANISLSIGKHTDELAKQRRWWLDAKQAETPRRTRIHASVMTDANGFGVMSFDNVPSTGRFWHLRKLSIGRITPATTATGAAFIYVSAQDYTRAADLTGLAIGDWVDQATALPSVGDFSPGEIPLIGDWSEQLFVVINGGAATTLYAAQGLVEDFQTASVSPDWPV